MEKHKVFFSNLGKLTRSVQYIYSETYLFEHPRIYMNPFKLYIYVYLETCLFEEP